MFWLPVQIAKSLLLLNSPFLNKEYKRTFQLRLEFNPVLVAECFEDVDGAL